MNLIYYIQNYEIYLESCNHEVNFTRKYAVYSEISNRKV